MPEGLEQTEKAERDRETYRKLTEKRRKKRHGLRRVLRKARPAAAA